MGELSGIVNVVRRGTGGFAAFVDRRIDGEDVFAHVHLVPHLPGAVSDD